MISCHYYKSIATRFAPHLHYYCCNGMLFGNFRGETEKFLKFLKSARRALAATAIPAMLPTYYGFPYGNLRHCAPQPKKCRFAAQTPPPTGTK
jgi:hypothetical protein